MTVPIKTISQIDGHVRIIDGVELPVYDRDVLTSKSVQKFHEMKAKLINKARLEAENLDEQYHLPHKLWIETNYGHAFCKIINIETILQIHSLLPSLGDELHKSFHPSTNPYDPIFDENLPNRAIVRGNFLGTYYIAMRLEGLDKSHQKVVEATRIIIRNPIGHNQERWNERWRIHWGASHIPPTVELNKDWEEDVIEKQLKSFRALLHLQTVKHKIKDFKIKFIRLCEEKDTFNLLIGERFGHGFCKVVGYETVLKIHNLTPYIKTEQIKLTKQVVMRGDDPDEGVCFIAMRLEALNLAMRKVAEVIWKVTKNSPSYEGPVDLYDVEWSEEWQFLDAKISDRWRECQLRLFIESEADRFKKYPLPVFKKASSERELTSNQMEKFNSDLKTAEEKGNSKLNQKWLTTARVAPPENGFVEKKFLMIKNLIDLKPVNYSVDHYDICYVRLSSISEKKI